MLKRGKARTPQTVGVHFSPWSLRSLVTSVLRPNWTSNSVLDHFGHKDRTDLAMNLLDYYTCKLFTLFTMKSIVLSRRKIGLQKDTLVREIIRWTDRSGVPKWLRHFGPWSIRSLDTLDL